MRKNTLIENTQLKPEEAEKEYKSSKEQNNQKKGQGIVMNMVTINPTVSMTTLSVNGLNTTFK
jgi:hypothetical protein